MATPLTYLKITGVVSVVVILTAAILVAKYERDRAGEAEARNAQLDEQLKAANAVNAEQAQSISRLASQIEIDAQASRDLAARLTEIQAKTDETRQALQDLRDNEPDARTFLDLPVPDSIKRVYGNR